MIRASLLASLFFAAAPALQAQSLDNLGTDFISAFLDNSIDGAPFVEVHLTSPTATSVLIEYPVNAPTFSTSVAVTPGTVTIVALPAAASLGWSDNAVGNNAVRCSADDEFVCYLINRRTFTSDAALALPIDTMNTEYIVTDYTPRFGPSQFVVFAAFDNTTVTITPSVALVGHPAGVPFNVTLNRGEGYSGIGAVSSGLAGSLTGTIISSDRPVGMTNGSFCVQVPLGTSACDHVFEVAQPVASWGSSALVANLPNRPGGTIYRVTASTDGTTVNQDGVPIGTINRGQFLETPTLPGSHVFDANNPIFVTQYMTSQSAPGASSGDPAMCNMVPSAQYLSNYTFSTVGANQFAQNFLTVFAENADVATITLDGVAIGAGNFTAVGTSGFSVAIVPLASGTHETASTGVHGIIVEGYNNFDSYLYPGGALFQFINDTGDTNPPLCNIINAPNNQTAMGIALDDRPSEDVNMNGILDPGEDLNMNGLIDEDTGVFFVQLLPGSGNVTLTVDPFVPGAGMVNFTAAIIDPMFPASGTVRITDGAGNETDCPVNLGVNECWMMLGLSEIYHPFGPELDDVLRVAPAIMYPVTQISIPTLTIPNNPALYGAEVYGQVAMVNPIMAPNNPVQFSNGLRLTVGVGIQLYGHQGGIQYSGDYVPQIGTEYNFWFLIN